MKIENARFCIPWSRCRQNFKFSDFTSSLCNTAVKRLRMCERWSGEKAAKMAVRACGLKL